MSQSCAARLCIRAVHFRLRRFVLLLKYDSASESSIETERKGLCVNFEYFMAGKLDIQRHAMSRHANNVHRDDGDGITAAAAS